MIFISINLHLFPKYITFASSVSNSTIDSFYSTSPIDSTPKDFFFIIANGLEPLRQGSIIQANVFFSFYSDLINQISLNLMAFMILGIIFTLAGALIIVKYVILIHKTNNKVISLFGMIKAVDIRTLTNKCEEFSEKYMENSLKQREKEKFNTSYGGPQQQEKPPKPSEEDQSYIQINGNNPTDNHHTDNQAENKLEVSIIDDKNNKSNTSIITKESNNNTMIMNALKGNSQIKSKPTQQMQIQSYLTPSIKSALIGSQLKAKSVEIIKNSNLKPDLSIVKGKEEEEVLKAAKPDDKDQITRDEIRQRRLMNTVDNNTKMILIQYSIFVFMFWAYFIADYVFFTVFLGQVTNCYSHLQLIAERPSIVKYRIVFTYEEIATSQNQIQPINIFDLSAGTVDVWEDYRNQFYSNEINIFNSLQIGYPSQFTEYTSNFQLLNYGDVCQNYYQTTDPTLVIGSV